MLDDLQWVDTLSFLFGLISAAAATAALFFARRASISAAKRFAHIEYLREREHRLEYLAKHPEDVTDQDIRELHLNRPSMS